MVNRLYSLLVSGCSDIDESCSMWRKHTIIRDYSSSLLPTTNDPLTRAAYACAVIKLAKGSTLYPYILEKDPANTYEIDPPSLHTCDDFILLFPYNLSITSSSILSESRCVPKAIRDSVNLDNLCDMAALLCLAVLYSSEV